MYPVSKTKGVGCLPPAVLHRLDDHGRGGRNFVPDDPGAEARRERKPGARGRASRVEPGHDDGAGHEVLPTPVKRSLVFLLLSISLWYIGYNGVTTWFTEYVARRHGPGPGRRVHMPARGNGRRDCLIHSHWCAGCKNWPQTTISAAAAAGDLLSDLLLPHDALHHSSRHVRLFALVGFAWAAINVNSLPMVWRCAAAATSASSPAITTPSPMAAQVVTPIVAGTLMRHISYRVLFPYAALFVARAL